MSPKTSSFADPQSWRPREPQGCEERGNALTGLVPTSASRDPALRLLGKEAPVLILKHRPEGRGFWAASSPSGGGPSFRASGSPSALLQPPGNNHPPLHRAQRALFLPTRGFLLKCPLASLQQGVPWWGRPPQWEPQHRRKRVFPRSEAVPLWQAPCTINSWGPFEIK